MPTSHENALQQRCQQIVTSPVLSPEQKRHFLALEAENNLPYPQLPAEARRALDEGVICDMFEGCQSSVKMSNHWLIINVHMLKRPLRKSLPQRPL